MNGDKTKDVKLNSNINKKHGFTVGISSANFPIENVTKYFRNQKPILLSDRKERILFSVSGDHTLRASNLCTECGSKKMKHNLCLSLLSGAVIYLSLYLVFRIIDRGVNI